MISTSKDPFQISDSMGPCLMRILFQKIMFLITRFLYAGFSGAPGESTISFKHTESLALGTAHFTVCEQNINLSINENRKDDEGSQNTWKLENLSY